MQINKLKHKTCHGDTISVVTHKRIIKFLIQCFGPANHRSLKNTISICYRRRIENRTYPCCLHKKNNILLSFPFVARKGRTGGQRFKCSLKTNHNIIRVKLLSCLFKMFCCSVFFLCFFLLSPFCSATAAGIQTLAVVLSVQLTNFV